MLGTHEFVKALQSKINSKTDKLQLTQAETRLVIDSLVESAKELVENGEEVNIVGFGKFSSKTKAAHVARNPRTGESVNVPEKTKNTFKISKSFKD